MKEKRRALTPAERRKRRETDRVEGASSKSGRGWYPDPEDPSRLRHWNGRSWSTRTRPQTKPRLPDIGGSRPGTPLRPDLPDDSRRHSEGSSRGSGCGLVALIGLGLAALGALIGGVIGYGMEFDVCHSGEEAALAQLGCVQSIVGVLVGFLIGLLLGVLIALFVTRRKSRGTRNL
jgi:hypothetical protein